MVPCFTILCTVLLSVIPTGVSITVFDFLLEMEDFIMINRQKHLHDGLEIKDIRCIHQVREKEKGAAIFCAE